MTRERRTAPSPYGERTLRLSREGARTYGGRGGTATCTRVRIGESTSTRKSLPATERTTTGSAIVTLPRDLAVLLVDADRAARIPLAHRLSDRYAVYEAEDGLMALRLASMIPNLAIVLSEITLPTLDGPDLAKVFRDHALLKDIPFVFLSDRASPNDVLRLRAGGAHDYLKKSLAPQTILHRVGKITRACARQPAEGSYAALAR